ncbi:MAG: molybdopterin-dependent oxidoreductase [Deltaproteobacteria bacterium]|nr:molybdopterin-dependent oxidoreductase [Deltaproteobacteria bacterium]
MSTKGKTSGLRGPTGRRRFAKLALATPAMVAASGSTATAAMAQPAVVIPPVGAEELTSACAFCIVGCGYRIYRWPVDEAPGGLSADDNALGVEFPHATPNRPWISPHQHNVVEVNGRLHHVVVLPDWKADVVNPGGDHTLGGVLARRLYSEGDPAKHDRLLRPQLRIGDEHVEITWDDAIELAGRLGRHVVDTHGELAWGMKTYSYQFYENTYAITKLAFSAVGTPCWAPHDQPRSGSSTPGLSAAGVDPFSAGYPDWREADVVFLSGVAVYEARGVLFSNWVSPTPEGDALVDAQGRPSKALVVANPRRDVAAQWAEDNGGIHLQLRPGTDAVLNNAIARVILDRGWYDEEFIAQYTVSDDELALESEGNAMRAAYGATFEQWRAMIEGDERYTLAEAAAITGVPAESIERAAALMAEPRPDESGHVRAPRTSLMLEKGNYWSHNFPNSASLVSLGLLVGAGNRSGRMISRGGGHQRGMMRAAPYPIEKSPETLQGRPAAIDLDQWTREGNLRLAWVIGCTWAGGGTAAAGPLFLRLIELTRETGPQLDEATAFPTGRDGPLDVEAVLDVLRARTDAGGTVLIQQDIYPQSLTHLADLVLPATSWGEGGFTRMQGERRLRYYAQITDAPGQCRADWEIVAAIARRMGYSGFDWPDADALFEEAVGGSSGTQACAALVEHAQSMGVPARQLLAEHGTRGLQCPLHLEDGELRQTPRFHDADVFEETAGERGGFRTSTGKAIFALGRWDDAVERQEQLAPRDGELWVINRRDSRTWSGMIEDRRIRHRMAQGIVNAVEMHPSDAAARGLSHGDRIRVTCASVVSAPVAVDGAFEGVVEISDRVQAGVTCAYFNYFGEVSMAANSVVSNTTDPINGMFSFKLGRGMFERLED